MTLPSLPPLRPGAVVVALLLFAAIQASAASDCSEWPVVDTCKLTSGVLAQPTGTTDLHVAAGEYSYFSLKIPDTLPSSVSIALNVMNGDPDLYIKRGDEQPSFSNSDYSSRTSGNEDVVTIPKAELAAGETYSVAVYGFTESSFMLMYSVSGDVSELVNGSPQSGSVDVRKYAYYSFVAHTRDPITIVLTKLSGDPDLLAAIGWKPTLGNSTWQELSFGDDVLTITVPPAQPLNTVYTIGVYGSVASDFTILASQDTPSLLLDGVPQSGALSVAQPREYFLRVQGSASEVTISLEVAVGELQYFISTSTAPDPTYPNRLTAMWAGQSDFFSPSSVDISPSDPHFLNQPGEYLITLYAPAVAVFTITAKTASAVVNLQDGRPKFDTVAQGEYHYYAVSVPDPNLNVVFDLTPFSGDPDMYVSCNKTLTGNDFGSPSRSHFSWASQGWGEDTIRVASTDPSSCASSTSLGGTFYVAVYGFRNASYSLVAAIDNGMPTALYVGQPQAGTAYTGQEVMYRLDMPGPTTDITISVSPSYGDPDLYVTLDGSQPSPTNFAYASYSTSGTDSVTITSSGDGCHSSDPAKCWCTPGGDQECAVLIGVYAFQNSSFSIVATTAEATLSLQDGVPVVETADMHSYEYFRFHNPTEGNVLQFVLTSISGDADLTVDRDPNRRPVLGNATWISVRASGDEVTIPYAEQGDYYIGVYGFTASVFSVMAHIVSSETINKRLIDGTPQAGTVEMEKYVYYLLPLQSAANVTVTLTPVAGQTALYIKRCQQSRIDDCRKDRPTIDTHDFSSYNSFSDESITIRSDQSCSQCVYVVGVYGISAANYTVLTSIGNAVTTLQEGLPARAQVDANEYKYFKFIPSHSNEDIIIAVTPFTGDPDVYVTACGYTSEHPNGVLPTCNNKPTSDPGDSDWHHASSGADTIVIQAIDPKACFPNRGTPPCTYYIGVRGFLPSDFSVLAYVHSNKTITVLDGVPQNGAVDAGVTDQYTMDIPPLAGNVQITLIPRSGDADLYVTLDGSIPTSSHYAKRSVSSVGNDNIQLSSTDDVWAAAGCSGGCALRIAVVGFRDSTYTLVATTSHDVTTLPPGVPVRDHVDVGATDYYKFSVDRVAEVSFILTPLSGDPDMYVGWGPDYTRPNATHNLWASAKIGVDVVNVYTTDAHACDVTTDTCNYYIGVYGFGFNTSFTIMAVVQSPDPIVIVDGQPQTGEAVAGVTEQFVYLASPGFRHVQVTLTPLYGDPDLYVSVGTAGTQNPPDPTHAQYRSAGTTGSETIVVLPDDAPVTDGCTGTDPCPIFVGINSFKDSAFTLVVSDDVSSSLLQNGVPLYDDVGPSEFKYYVFRNDDPNSAVSFSLTPFAGDPDLYVSTVEPHPSPTNYTKRSAGIGRDVIEIFPGEDGYCVAPCEYYVGVTGFHSNASYSVMASQQSNAIVRMTPGEPQIAAVAQKSSDNYVIFVAPGTPTIIVVLTPLFGDADLYVNVGETRPTVSNHQFSSVASSGYDEVVITKDHPAYQNSACADLTKPVCFVRVAVVGFSDVAFYAITADTSNAALLLDGSPQRSSVGGREWRQFMFEVRQPGTEILITLTPLSGDPDMYVSTTPVANDTNWHWRAVKNGVDVIEIYPSDEHACEAPCRYYIGVTGFVEAAQFSIGARTLHSAPSLLLNGQPQTGFVNGSRSALYVFDVPAGAPEFTVTVSSTYGDPDLYIRLDGDTPTPTHYQYSAVSSRAQDSITIKANDPLFQNCTQSSVDQSRCRASIAVYGYSASQFSLTATTSTQAIELQQGIPTSEAVDYEEYEYFRFTLSQPIAVDIILTPLSGDPDMYVGNANLTQPKFGSSYWQAAGVSTERIHISPTDDRVTACGLPCTYYIGVTPFGGPASFQILVTPSNQTSGSMVTLRDGIPQRGTAPSFSFALYQFRAAANAGTLTFTVTPLSGDVVVFANNAEDSDGAVIPPSVTCGDTDCSVENAIWGSYSNFERATITIPVSDPDYCDSCAYAIGVASATDIPSDFNIVASSEASFISLAPGVPQSGYVGKDAIKYYRVPVSDGNADLEINLTPYTGDPDLYVSWEPEHNHPGPDGGWNVRSNSQFTDTILIQALDLQSCIQEAGTVGAACSVYLGVFGFSNSSYSLVASTRTGWNSSVFLIDGYPQTSVVEQGKYAYFGAMIDLPPGTAYSFSLTASYGDPDLYVTTDGLEPGKGHSNFQSRVSGYDTVLIAPEDAGYCNPCRVYLAVYGFTESRFTVTYSTNTSSSITSLRDGVSEYGQVSAGTYKYYKFFVDGGVDAIDLSVSALSGEPELYVTVEEKRQGRQQLPSASHNTWSSVRQGGRVVSISKDDPAFSAGSTYLVGVYSEAGSSFFLTISLSHAGMTGLVEGQPQVASVSANVYSYFTFSSRDTSRDITFRTSNPALVLYATNLYNESAPSELPTAGHYIWSSLSDESSQNILNIKHTDPHVTPGLSHYTIGVLSQSAVTFTITASTTETVITLLPGVPSTRHFVPTNSTQHFRLDVRDLTRDIIVSLAPLTGDPDLYISSRHPNPGCVFHSQPNPFVPNADCFNYTWSSAMSSRDILHIPAAAPCTRPPASANCDVARDFVVGTYYIGVFGYNASVYDITAFLAGANTLEPGQPLIGTTNNDVPMFFHFEISESDNQPSIKIDIDPFSTVNPLNLTAGVLVYASACKRDQCTPEDSEPGPFHYTWTTTVEGGSSPLFIADGDPNYCSPSGVNECNYYIGVYPDARCRGTGSCSVDFQIRVNVQDGSGITTVLYSDIDNEVDMIPDLVPVGHASRYELWLRGADPSSKVFFDLEACAGGAGNPQLFVCDATCPDPPSPSSADNVGHARVASTSASGHGTLNVPVPPDVLYAAVEARTGGRRLGESAAPSAGQLRRDSRTMDTELVSAEVDAVSAEATIDMHRARRMLSSSRFLSIPMYSGSSSQWTYLLRMSAAPIDFSLAPVSTDLMIATPDAAADGRTIVGLNVEWGPVKIQGPGLSKVASGVKYTVYLSLGGFPVGTVTTTPCGLAAGADVGLTRTTTRNSALITNLVPGAEYEVNVVAECDAACWELSEMRSDQLYINTVAFKPGKATAPHGTKKDSGMSTTVLVTIIVACIAAVVALVGTVVYCRRKRGQREYQYELYDFSDNAGTYSTPAGAYTAM